MSLDLDAIRARAAAATPGPWWAATDEVGFCLNDQPHAFVYTPSGDSHDVIALTGMIGEHHASHPDAEFIAAARADVPALLAEVDRLRFERDALAADADRAIGQIERLLRELTEQRHFALSQPGEAVS